MVDIKQEIKQILETKKEYWVKRGQDDNYELVLFFGVIHEIDEKNGVDSHYVEPFIWYDGVTQLNSEAQLYERVGFVNGDPQFRLCYFEVPK